MGSSPAIKIARHIVTLLSTRNIETTALAPAAPVPVVRVARPARHHPAAASREVSQIVEPAMMVRPPKLQIHIVLDGDFPALPAISDSEDALVCRKPETLIGSRFPGPVVCLHADQWAKLQASGLDVGPDGRSIIRSDYEKQRALTGESCPQPQNVGASTGWSGGSVNCF